MNKALPSKRDLIAALASNGNSHTIITREFWKNGQQTTESHRYTANEMAEIFDRDQLVTLIQGGMIERAPIGHAPRALTVSAEALAFAAFAKKAVR